MNSILFNHSGLCVLFCSHVSSEVHQTMADGSGDSLRELTWIHGVVWILFLFFFKKIKLNFNGIVESLTVDFSLTQLLMSFHLTSLACVEE